MKKRKLKDILGDIMLLGFLLTTVFAIMFFFIYSYNGIDGEELRNIIVFAMFMLLFISGFIFSLDRKQR